MARSSFPKHLVRPAGGNDTDGQLLQTLYNHAFSKALEVSESALSREVDTGAQMVEDEALTLMADMLKDEVRIGDDEYLELKSRIAKRLRTSTGLKPDRAEIERHAVAISQTLVRAWLQHLLDLNKLELAAEEVLPRTDSSPGWQKVWDSVASYNVRPIEGRYILRQMCSTLYYRSGTDRIPLPKGLAVPRSALEQAIELSSTVTRRPALADA